MKEKHSKNYTLGFKSLEKEAVIDNLEIKGIVPPWLDGTLLRTGPAKFELTRENIRHWFDGLAMLHSFTFRKGNVGYVNKFLKGSVYRDALSKGRLTSRGFATDPCRSIFKRISSFFVHTPYDNGNVNVARLSKEYVALTEVPLPVEFDPQTLDTLGIYKFNDTLKGQTTTAHPHFDFQRKESLNYLVQFGRQSFYHIYRQAEGDKARGLITALPVKEPAYMHSFAITKHYCILAEFPFKVSPFQLLIRPRSFIENFRWLPDQGTKFIVVNRLNGKLVGEFLSSPFFAFHHVNAFEDNEDSLVLDIVTYKDPSIIKALYIEVLLKNFKEKFCPSILKRFTINIKKHSVKSVSLIDDFVELPRINYEGYNTRPYGFLYAVGIDKDDFFNRLVKVDIAKRHIATWEEVLCYPSEPVVVPRPHAKGEDEGVILSVVLDAKRGSSFLLLLDAKTFEEMGRAIIPHHIPFGFHGNYYRV